MKLDKLLTHSDLTDFNHLVQQAHQAGAGGVRYYSETQHLVVIGIIAQGELMTWFASPAHSDIEALATERVVVAGMQVASSVLADMLSMRPTDAQALAQQVIKKASSIH